MIKAIIFDFDGTIADSFQSAIDASLEIGKQYSYYADRAIADFRKISQKDLMRELKVPKRKVNHFTKEARRIMLETWEDLELFPGMEELITKLAEKYPLGIVSSNSEQIILNVLGKKNLLDKFQVISAGSWVFKKSKKLKKVAKKLGAKPEECIYVDDTTEGVAACRQCGMKIISVPWGYHEKEMLKSKEPDYLPEEVLDILKIIQDETS